LKFVDEYRDEAGARKLADAIAGLAKGNWTIMEICGGQTHTIVRSGIDQLLPGNITLLHGPGCPVCVTPLELVDKAIAIAEKKEVIFCSFGDMLRVPGSDKDLLSAKAEGADIRIVYSPLDAIKIAADNQKREIVFFGVGFETTAPANAMAIQLAATNNIKNFSMLVSHVLVPPAIEAILGSADNRVDGFLAAGHVCAVMGYSEYEPIAAKYRVPIVVTGFEPLDILEGLYYCVQELEGGRNTVINQYSRAVNREGNLRAKKLIADTFRIIDRKWRGIGLIPKSGLGLRDEFRDFDAEIRFGVSETKVEESSECISGLILRGIKKPPDCPVFGRKCNPEHPLGATMVSSEGACAAYYRYRRINPVDQ
jgi:hydrogenase expression/formation protein HypD